MSSSENGVGYWSPASQKEALVQLTKSALHYLQKQIQKKGEGVGVHFGVKKSGCSGYAYILDIITDVESFPYQVKCADNFIIAIDKESLPFIKGTEIDFVRDGLNGILKFNNPNETASCGCGESFSIDKTDF